MVEYIEQITKEQAIDILERFDFFQGQRAGRELWNDKPFGVQEEDISNFSRDVKLLKEYISADVVPRAEVEHILSDIKRQIHDKAIYPNCHGVEPYISLKVFDAVINKLIGS